MIYNLCEIESKDTRSHKTVVERIKIAFYSIENSINKAAENFWVERKSIRKWREQFSELGKVSSKSKTKTLHKGKKTNAKDIEGELDEWILVNWSLDIFVTLWEVITKACSLD